MAVLVAMGASACSRGDSPDDDAPERQGAAGAEPSGPAGTAADPSQPATRTLTGDESFPEGFTVPAGEIWELDPGQTTTVETEANVVVEGTLRMQPSDPGIVHTLRFTGFDETQFVGAEEAHEDHDHQVTASDVGLWVIGEGQLDIVGSERAGWNRSGTDPTWQSDDDIRVAPTDAGDTTTFAEFEPGGTVPAVEYAGEMYPTEVFNLTRNVRIEGSGDGGADPEANGRAHIWIGSNQPQTIRFAELRHLGPRQSNGDATEGVLGRYPLHFHKVGEGSRGSVVEGVVVTDSGNRAFVPHGSHGITFRDTIAYNVFDDAYWWDPDDTGHGGPATNFTNDLVYDHAMAALVRTAPEFRGYTLSGFVLGEGENMTVTDSVAVGVQGNNTASGFHWPATANGTEHNIWSFQDNIAHNNKVSGIFVWQNDDNDHVVEDFVAYRNGSFGVDHGAYVNNYAYDGLVLFDNDGAGIRSKAASTDESQTWRNIDTDSILIADRALDSDTPVVIEDVTVRGEVVVDERGDDGSARALYEFRNVVGADGSTLSTDAFDLRHQVSDISVTDADGHSVDL